MFAKKVLCLILAALLVGGLAGCGQPEPNEPGGPDETDTQQPAGGQDAAEGEFTHVYDIYDPSGFDPSLYNGMVYKDGAEMPVTELLAGDGTLATTGAFFHSIYYLTADEEAWDNASRDWANSTFLEKLVETLGQPSSIYAKYGYNDSDEYTGYFYFIYNYGDYYLVYVGSDFTNWGGNYNYTHYNDTMLYVAPADTDLGASIGGDYVCYGEPLA